MARTSAEGSAHLLLRAFLYWLPVALCVTILSGLVYVAVQQSYRQSATDPQIQMAEDAAALLEQGVRPQDVVGGSKVDIASSLAPFMIIYDASGHVVASSAQLNGSAPDLPPGVFDSVRASGEDRLTWQPQEGVRVAAVIARYRGPSATNAPTIAPRFVLAGRSLREVEERESQLTQMVGIAWIVAMVGAFVAWLVALAVSDRITGRRAT